MFFENCKYDHLTLADRFLNMAEKFMPYAAIPKNELDMGECNVKTNKCGTVACHGGYAAITFNAGNYYENGANKLAEYFGFDKKFDLKNWAQDNPAIWGNNYGDDMFASSMAFGIHCDDDIYLKDIVAHYLSVAKRLIELKV